MARPTVAAAALAAALLVPAAPVLADEVTNADDDGAGSLRSAIAGTPAGGTVTFAPGLAGGTILLTSELVIDKDLTLDGPGARQLAISGQDATRVLHIFGAGTEVQIDDLTIRNGRAAESEALGSGVLVTDGELVLTRVAVLDNEATSTTRVPFGGGIAAVLGAHLELVDSTVAGNRAPDGGGGGIFAGVPATFEIVNSTLAGNSAAGGAGLLSLDATGVLRGSTIARNAAANVGGGVGASLTAAVTLERSLVSTNSAVTGAACDGNVINGGDNVTDSACFADSVASAPVGTLGDHGGPTDTLLPLPGSPAIDHIAGPCAGSDQRGVPRPQGAGCDAGAVEIRSGLTASGPLVLGSAEVGQYSAPVSVEVTNAGEYDAGITSVSVSGPNAAEVEPVGDPDACTDATVLAPNASCKLVARLAPTSAGAKQATYTVALGGSDVQVPVTGTGDPVPQPPAGPSGGDSTPPPPSSAQAVLVGTSTKAAKRGKLKLRLHCTTVNAARCAGSVTLKVGARKLRKAYSIAAGKQAVVTLELGAGDRRRLARKRSLRSAVTVITVQPDGTRKTTHQGSLKLLRA